MSLPRSNVISLAWLPTLTHSEVCCNGIFNGQEVSSGLQIPRPHYRLGPASLDLCDLPRETCQQKSIRLTRSKVIECTHAYNRQSIGSKILLTVAILRYLRNGIWIIRHQFLFFTDGIFMRFHCSIFLR